MIDILFSQVNLPLTILSGLLVVYWLLTMITGVDWDVDFDVDIDVDIDLDADVDLDTHVEGSELGFDDAANVEVNKDQVVNNRRKPLKWWQVVLIHFNFVGLPFMFTLTTWILFWWIATLLSTTITLTYNSSFGFIWFFAMILPSLYITKLFTTPFKSFFKNFNKDGDKEVDFIGLQGELLDTIFDDRFGRVEVNFEKKVLIVHAKSLNQENINRGSNVLIIKSTNDNSMYFVQEYKDNL